MKGAVSEEEYRLLGDKFVLKMKEAETSTKWEEKEVIKGEKPYTVYKMEIENRISTKGITAKVEGSLKDLSEMLRSLVVAFKLDPQMSECRKIQELAADLTVLYMKYKGVGPVSDRDFVVLEKTHFENDGAKLYHVLSSCPYPYSETKDVVRGEVVLAGYIGEKIDDKSFRLTYVSDCDVKGSIPDFVKKILSGSQDDIVSKVEGFLKEYRALKK